MRFLFGIVLSACLLWGAPAVSVSILPQAYFVEKIADDTVEINVMVGPGHSPATYEPKPQQMAALDKSSLYFSIGVPFERTWLPKLAAAAPHMRVVATDEGIAKRMMGAHDHDHEHHNHAKHEGTPDPHIWLDPILVKSQVSTIATALIEAFPAHKARYEYNVQAFMAELDALHASIKAKLDPLHDATFMVFHPSWGYFAQRYHLNQVAIEVEGKEPKPAALGSLITKAKAEKVRAVFVSPQFSTKSAQTIAHEIGAHVVALDPLSVAWEEELLKSVNILSNSLK
jgi:zinc transport system substrate-binding protein